MTKTYHGSCHCGAVAFEADVDFSQDTKRCNCSFCRETRNWGTYLPEPETLKITKGETEITHYYGREAGPDPDIVHAFCRHCGTRLFSTGNIPEMGGRFANVFVPTLDDATPEELIAAPLFWCDGLHDNWWNPPEETRHL